MHDSSAPGAPSTPPALGSIRGAWLCGNISRACMAMKHPLASAQEEASAHSPGAAPCSPQALLSAHTAACPALLGTGCPAPARVCPLSPGLRWTSSCCCCCSCWESSLPCSSKEWVRPWASWAGVRTQRQREHSRDDALTNLGGSEVKGEVLG